MIGFFRWAVAAGELDYDPTAGLPKIKMPRGRPHPVDDVTLLTALDGAEPWPWLHLAMILAGWAGLRCCEIAPLRGDDITDQILTVQRGKGGKSGEVPTHPRVWAEVADLPGGNLMEATGGRADADWLSRAARWRLRRLGVTEGGLHRWRHTCATRLLASGANIRVVQEVLRHESLTSTQIYTDVSAELRTAMAGLT